MPLEPQVWSPIVVTSGSPVIMPMNDSLLLMHFWPMSNITGRL